MSQANNVSGGEFDPRDYTGPARVAAPFAQHVARGLEAALPADATAEERAALARTSTAASVLAACLLDREQTSAGRVRPVFTAFGTVWSVFGERLSSLARLPAEASPRGPQAAALWAEVLPEATSFAQTASGQAWAAAERRLQYIDQKGLGPVLGELVGADVLEAARRATAALREVSGAEPFVDAGSSTAVGEKLANFSRLVGIYCRLLASKLDEADPATVERFRRAVAPLEQYRASRRGLGDQEEPEPEVIGDPNIPPGMPGSPPFITEPRI